MGSSGEKRKGRTHLPKVGTPKNNSYELHERREEALHPFSDDPDRRRGPLGAIVVVVVAIVVVLGIIGLVLLT